MIESNVEPQTSHDKEVFVEMYRYNFNFTIDGVTVTDYVTLSTGINYLFNVTAIDVQHGMNVNGNTFDSMPGEYQTAIITFTTAEIISYKCNIACGTGHGSMNGEITVESTSTTTTSSTTDTNTDTPGDNITTVTTTETVDAGTTETLVETTTQTQQVVSNQTFTEERVVTTTLIEQVSFPMIGLFLSFIFVVKIRSRLS